MQIYIHIPFCKSKCSYCDFNSVACNDEATIFSYLAALRREIKLAGELEKGQKISTIYIGGGTPSLLPEKCITDIAKAVGEAFDLSGLTEFTIECNPESMTERKLEAYKAAGVNRLSVGVQSLSDANLKSVGRIHTAEQALKALELAGSLFDNLSADVIIGLPYDDADVVKWELETLMPLVKHMSVYQLTLEQGTPLATKVEQGRVLLPSDDEVADFENIAVALLKEGGFERYEVSNFAKKGYLSEHNMGYWTHREYMGFGADAHSFVKHVGASALEKPLRYASPKDINAYIAGINCVDAYDKIPRVDIEALSAKDMLSEAIMLGLRTSRGVNSVLLDGKIGDDIKKYFTFKDGRTALTDEGMAVMNSLLVRLM